MERQYMLTQSYFEPTPAEMKKLVREAAELRDVVESPKASWVERQRSAARLKDVEGKIQVSRTGQRQAEQVQQRHAAPPGYVVSDCGTALTRVQNVEPQFAEPIPAY